MENNQKTAYETAAEELGVRLVALQKLRLFPRNGKVFADLLFTAGVEAGALIQAMSQITDRELKIETANEALLQISRAEYILGIMCSAKYYSAREVYELKSYISKVKDSLKELLKNAREADRIRQARLFSESDGLDDPV